jgi:hypothetical protein
MVRVAYKRLAFVFVSSVHVSAAQYPDADIGSLGATERSTFRHTIRLWNLTTDIPYGNIF